MKLKPINRSTDNTIFPTKILVRLKNCKKKKKKTPQTGIELN